MQKNPQLYDFPLRIVLKAQWVATIDFFVHKVFWVNGGEDVSVFYPGSTG